MSKGPTLKILVADADPSVKTALRLFLGKDGADVLDAADGERALFMARTIPLDLLLVDDRLPKHDAIEILRTLRADPTPRLRTLPIVILTANTRVELAARARTHGATELLQKPLTTAAMAALLRRMERKRSNGSGAGWSSVQTQAHPGVPEDPDKS